MVFMVLKAWMLWRAQRPKKWLTENVARQGWYDNELQHLRRDIDALGNPRGTTGVEYVDMRIKQPIAPRLIFCRTRACSKGNCSAPREITVVNK